MPTVPGYMSRRIVRSYYDDLNEKLDGSMVDKIWNVVLNIYFTTEEDFGVEVQAHHNPKKGEEDIDATIAYVHYATSKRTALCLFEDKRVEYEEQDSVWTTAKEHLTEYMLTQRRASRQENEVIYGVVTVGRYSRFYQLNPGQTELDYYPDTTHDDIFEFKKNEREILDILLAIKAVVSRPPTPASRPASNGGSRLPSNAGSRPLSSMGSRPPSSTGSRPVSRAGTRSPSRG